MRSGPHFRDWETKVQRSSSLFWSQTGPRIQDPDSPPTLSPMTRAAHRPQPAALQNKNPTLPLPGLGLSHGLSGQRSPGALFLPLGLGVHLSFCICPASENVEQRPEKLHGVRQWGLVPTRHNYFYYRDIRTLNWESEFLVRVIVLPLTNFSGPQ